MLSTYELELRPGHTVTRVDSESRLGAGRKGRAAEVTLHRTLTCTCGALTCTCGGHLGFVGLTVAEDLAKLRHFESAADHDAYEAENARLRESLLRSLGLS